MTLEVVTWDTNRQEGARGNESRVGVLENS